MNLLKSIFLGSIIALLSACASQSLIEKYQGQSDKEIFTAGEKKMLDDDMDAATEHFQALQVLYPFGPYARQTQLNIIYTQYASGDYTSAEAAAQRYLHLYPLGPNADYAYYMQGLAEFTQSIGFFERHFALDRGARDLAAYQKAFANFVILIQRYPNSLYSADAHKRLIYLRDIFAQHYLHIAQYYYSRKAYVAAAERASVIVTNYQRTSSVPAALILMAKSYQKLNLSEQAQDTIEVLKLNYPDSVADLK